MTLNSEGLEKARRWFDAEFNGLPNTEVLTTGIVSAYLSALPPVDGLEVVAHAYVVEGECEQIEWGPDVLLPDDPSLVELTSLSQASSVIAGLKEANEALMRERTSLIETKREQIERLEISRGAASKVALEAIARAEAAEARVKELEEGALLLLSEIDAPNGIDWIIRASQRLRAALKGGSNG